MLLERDRELDLLADVLHQVDEFGGKVVLVRGEAGIGKSALVRGFLERLSAEVDVFLGHCDDLQTPQPFAPLWDIARDAPSLHDALLEHDRLRVFDALIGVLERTLGPNVLVIEDSQWSDEATLDAIRYVGRRIARTHGLLLLTYRDGDVDVDHPLRTVIGDLPPANLVRIELSALSRVAVTELIGRPKFDTEPIFRVTGGNPFLVTELSTAGGDAIPSSVRDSAAARISRLSPASRELLRVLSVVPDRLHRDEVATLTGRSDVDAELAECERRGLIEVEGDSASFRHELLRRAVEASLTISEQVATHRALLERLPDTADATRWVHHARGANDAARLVEYAPLAARAAAAVGSHREALAHYRALDPHLDQLAIEDRVAILLDWARIEHYLGNRDAVDLVARAVELQRRETSDVRLALAITTAAQIARGAGRFLEAVEHAGEAVRLLRPLGPGADLVRALSEQAMSMVDYGDGPSDAIASEAITMARRIGAEAAAFEAFAVEAILAYLHGEPDAPGLLERVRCVAEAGMLRYEEADTLLMAAFSALEVRDLIHAADYCRRARETARRYEIAGVERYANGAYAEILLWKGSWVEAEDLATETLATSPNDRRLHAIIGMLRTRSGQPGGLEHLERAWSGTTGTDARLRAAAGLAERSWLVGDVDRELVDSFPAVIDDGMRTGFPWPVGSLALWLARLGIIDEPPRGTPEPYADAIRGDVRAAAAFWEARHAPFERATALAGGNQADRLEALELFETLGATAVAAKVRHGLRVEGVVAPRGRARTTRTSPAGLTTRQSEILRLLDEGLTNAAIADRLFVSHRTVENHVSALLAKLDAPNRDEAVVAARAAGLLSIS